MTRLVPALTAVLCVSACVDTPPSGPPQDIPAPGPATFAVVTSDFSSGTLHVVDAAQRRASSAIDIVDGDAGVFVFGGRVYVLDRTHGTGRVYDPGRGWRDPSEFPVGNAQVPQAQANPYDLYVDEPRRQVLVTLYGARGARLTGAQVLGVMDLDHLAAGIQRFIPLSDGTGDSNPEADRLVACGERLYVVLQDLDRTDNYRPAGPGKLAIVSLATLQVEGYIPLRGNNPVAMQVVSADCSLALVGHADYQLEQSQDQLTDQGGVERVDLQQGRSLDMARTARQLGGNVTALAAVDEERVFVALSNKTATGWDNRVYRLDLRSGAQTAVLSQPLSFVPTLRVTNDWLLVPVQGTPGAGQLAAGLYVGSVAEVPLLGAPISLGLAPYGLAALPAVK